MKLTGIQQTTLVDYPGKIACVVFTPGCNLRCRYCYNPECVLPELIAKMQDDYITEEAFLNFLRTRRGLLDGVSICGGEPTLQSDLLAFATKIKELGFLVKLDTNGRDVEIIKKMIADQVVDYIAVDCKQTIEKYELITKEGIDGNFFENFIALRDLLRSSSLEYEYRSTIIKGLHTAEDIESMAQFLTGIPHYYLQNYLPSKTLDPSFVGESFSQQELSTFQTLALKYIAHVGIRA